MKLSIIIPCYNAEPYINELIDCLKPQLNDDVEVIVVDDGSKKPYKTSAPIKVIRKENGGASSARNCGLDNASGEYISFIDADDIVSVDYVKKLLETGKTYKIDGFVSPRTGKSFQAYLKLEDGKAVFDFSE